MEGKKDCYSATIAGFSAKPPEPELTKEQMNRMLDEQLNGLAMRSKIRREAANGN